MDKLTNEFHEWLKKCPVPWIKEDILQIFDLMDDPIGSPDPEDPDDHYHHNERLKEVERGQ